MPKQTTVGKSTTRHSRSSSDVGKIKKNSRKFQPYKSNSRKREELRVNHEKLKAYKIAKQKKERDLRLKERNRKKSKPEIVDEEMKEITSSDSSQFGNYQPSYNQSYHSNNLMPDQYSVSTSLSGNFESQNQQNFNLLQQPSFQSVNYNQESFSSNNSEFAFNSFGSFGNSGNQQFTPEPQGLFAHLDGAEAMEGDEMFSDPDVDVNEAVSKDFHAPGLFSFTNHATWEDPTEAVVSNVYASSNQSEEELSDKEINRRYLGVLDAVQNCSDTLELESTLPELRKEYDLKYIRLDGLGTKNPVVKGQINPEFTINVSALEMRGEPSSGGAYATKATWQAQNITLDQSYVVGKKMTAYPLGPDTMRGTSASGNKDQKWMAKTAYGSQKRGGFKGGENRYIRGHLLNDNLGGPANQYNLFPITEDANHQHSNNAEEFIKGGIENGYVYAYEVEIQNPSVKTILGKKGLYSIDCDLQFHFARLNAKKEPIKETEHKGLIKSRFGAITTTEFWDETNNKFEAKDKSDEYKDYKAGSGKKKQKGDSVYDPLVVKNAYKTNSKSLQTPLKKQDDKNYTNTTSAFSGFTFPSFHYGSSLLTLTTNTTQPQSINKSADRSSRISICQSKADDVAARFGDKGLVNNWSATDVKSWQSAVISQKLRKWDDVADEAQNHKLDAAIADELFATDGLGREKVTINGKP